MKYKCLDGGNYLWITGKVYESDDGVKKTSERDPIFMCVMSKSDFNTKFAPIEDHKNIVIPGNCVEWVFDVRNPVTTCNVVFSNFRTIAMGFSRCHPGDVFSKEIGMRKAVEMIGRIFRVFMADETRAKFEAYFQPVEEHYNEPIKDFLVRRFTKYPPMVKCVNPTESLLRMRWATIGKVYKLLSCPPTANVCVEMIFASLDNDKDYTVYADQFVLVSSNPDREEKKPSTFCMIWE